MIETLSRRGFLTGAACLATSAALNRVVRAIAVAPTSESQPAKPFPFYVMDTGLRGPDVPELESKVKLAKDLGFTGVDYTYNAAELPRMMELLDKHELELSAVYLSPSLGDKLDEHLDESIRQMKGRPTRIELAIQSKKYKPSDPAGDAEALDIIGRVADRAADTGPVVSIYPHAGAWTERVDDGVRLAAAARASGRKNVGGNFNLVHWKWVKQTRTLEETLKASLPYLYLVTINGLDVNRIVSLDQGDYDLAEFLALLQKIGYSGRVGLQGYGIPGPSADHLKRSIGKWSELMKGFGG